MITRHIVNITALAADNVIDKSSIETKNCFGEMEPPCLTPLINLNKEEHNLPLLLPNYFVFRIVYQNMIILTKKLINAYFMKQCFNNECNLICCTDIFLIIFIL